MADASSEDMILWDLFRPEWRKFILPVISVLVVVSAVFIGQDLRAQGIDEAVLDEDTGQEVEQNELVMAERILLSTIYYTPLYPIAPGGAAISELGPGYEPKALYFTNEEGYYLTEEVAEGEVTEVGLVHFVPAMIIAFTWNYFLSCFLITYRSHLRNGFRRVRRPL